MPIVEVNPSDRYVHELELIANIETELHFGREIGSVEIIVISSSAPVYFTVDGTEAIVRGGNCRVMFPGPNAQIVPVSAWANAVIRMISEQDAIVSVLT